MSESPEDTAVTDDHNDQSAKLPDQDLARVLKEISGAAEAVVESDAIARAQIKAIADRLHEAARQAHVFATSPTFVLVEDDFGQGKGVYGHLAIGPHGFYLATRSEWEDITDQGLAPTGEALYSTLGLQNWPVEWLRIIIDRNLMGQLANCLHLALKEYLANPSKNAEFPVDMQLPSPTVVDVATQLSFPKVVEAWREAQRERLTNPAGALRTACVLLETVCKHILHECQAEIPETPILTKLYKAAAKELNMDSDEQTLATGLKSVVDGIAHGRSHLSNAHGSGPEQANPTATHVELAVTAAGALAVHLMKLLPKRQRSAQS